MMKSLFKIMMALIATLAIHSCTNDDMMQDIATNAPLKFEIGDYPAFEDGARIIGTPDVGKTDWVDGDIVLVKVISETSTETFTLTYGNKIWTASKQVSATGTPTIEVIYAPECEWGTDDNIQLKSEQSPYGTFEYMMGDCTLSGSTVSVNFYGKRTYSRLRLVPSNISGSIDVTTTGFTPAGPASTEVPAKYTLQTDSKGNAYLYGNFASNAVITVKKDNVLLKEYKFSSASTIGKSYAMEVADTTPYVTFTAEAQQTLTMSKAVETFEYSVNNGEWKPLGTSPVAFGGTLGNLRLRGKNLQGTLIENSYGHKYNSQISFGNSTSVSCSGDIRTLLDYSNYLNVTTKYANFMKMFYNCTQLTSTPDLPAKDLAYSCYDSMFYGCTNLISVSKLPAEKLSTGCYYMMFYGCTNLLAPPVLPAMTMYKDCYRLMFHGCTNLTEPPVLPATELNTECYQGMFGDCINLKRAPILPAMTMYKGCYQGMFCGCTSLKEAPKLPATTLAENCYNMMFDGCTNLTEAPELPATTLAKSCYYSMFEGCSSLTEVPNLPATTLADNCYEYMFAKCKSLINAPNLPASTLTKGCYASMFFSCNSLKKSPVISALVLSEKSCSRMFYNCSSLEKSPELSAVLLANNCYEEMFGKCINLLETPILSASSLADNCYKSMFAGCTRLSKVIMLATTFSSNCFSGWLSGVSSTGTFVKAPEMTTLPTGSDGIPSGWTVVDYEE